MNDTDFVHVFDTVDELVKQFFGFWLFYPLLLNNVIEQEIV